MVFEVTDGIRCGDFYEILKNHRFTFFSGVPDSTFKDWMNYLADSKDLINVVAVNECEAVALCTGHYLASGDIGVVYMQNSGLGKTVNPITSLADPDVYGIPLLLLIGWRGEPGKKDEPQHKKMGRIMQSLLDTLEIPHEFLPTGLDDAEKVVRNAKQYLSDKKTPYALIVRKGTFHPYDAKTSRELFELTREDAIKTIVDTFNGTEAVVSTTGKTSRELFEYREALKSGHKNDFYTVGSMGCASSIALGISLEKKERQVYIFDGDGAALMQMGSIATIGHYKPENLRHIIFDNNAHDSTGGQPTVSDTVEFRKIALACGYECAVVVESRARLLDELTELRKARGPSMIVVKTRKGSRKTLGRPTKTPEENKNAFMAFLR